MDGLVKIELKKLFEIPIKVYNKENIQKKNDESQNDLLTKFDSIYTPKKIHPQKRGPK